MSVQIFPLYVLYMLNVPPDNYENHWKGLLKRQMLKDLHVLCWSFLMGGGFLLIGAWQLSDIGW